MGLRSNWLVAHRDLAVARQPANQLIATGLKAHRAALARLIGLEFSTYLCVTDCRCMVELERMLLWAVCVPCTQAQTEMQMPTDMQIHPDAAVSTNRS